MLSCELKDLCRADFIQIHRGCSSLGDEEVFLVDVVIGGFSYELCEKQFPLEFETYVDALEAIRSHVVGRNYDFRTIFTFDDNDFSCSFNSVRLNQIGVDDAKNS